MDKKRMYWDRAHELYRGDDKEYKDAVKNDRAAWTLAAALILTICVPASMVSAADFVPHNAFNDQVSGVYVAALATCTSACLMCIWNATLTYLKLNMLPAHKTLRFMELLEARKRRLGKLGVLIYGVAVWANIAFVSLCVLVSAAVYLFFGARNFYIATPILVSAIGLALVNETLLKGMFMGIMEEELHGGEGRHLASGGGGAVAAKCGGGGDGAKTPAVVQGTRQGARVVPMSD